MTGARDSYSISQPAGHSVDDGIDVEQYRVSYTSVNEAFRLVFDAGGAGALLANSKCTKRELLSVVGRLGACRRAEPSAAYWSSPAPSRPLSIGSDSQLRPGLTYSGGPSTCRAGQALFPLLCPDDCTTDIVFYTDSSRWVTSACYGRRWWYVQWSDTIAQAASPSMTWLELMPVLVSCVCEAASGLGSGFGSTPTTWLWSGASLAAGLATPALWLSFGT